jgi:amino acid permease
MSKDFRSSEGRDMILMDSFSGSSNSHGGTKHKNANTGYDDNDSDSLSSKNSIYKASVHRAAGANLHDDSDLSNDTHGEVGKGLQRNLQARHLTMISLGKR